MQKIFITGGAGFIGSAFIQLLLDSDPSALVTNFDNLTYAGNLDNLAGITTDRYRFMKGDIADPRAVMDALDHQTDVVVNFAAESHVDRSISSAAEFLRTNVIGTQVLLDASRACGVKRFVHI